MPTSERVPKARRARARVAPSDNHPMIWQEPAKGGYPDVSLVALPGIERHRAGREGRTPHSPMSYLTELRMTAGSRGHSTLRDARLALVRELDRADPRRRAGGDRRRLPGLGRPRRPARRAADDHRRALADLPAAGAAPSPERTITGSGQLIHRGRSMGLSEAFLFDEARRADRPRDLALHRLPAGRPDRPSPPGELPVLDQPLPGREPRRSAAPRARGRGDPAGGVRAPQRPARCCGRSVGGELPAVPAPPPDRASG